MLFDDGVGLFEAVVSEVLLQNEAELLQRLSV